MGYGFIILHHGKKAGGLYVNTHGGVEYSIYSQHQADFLMFLEQADACFMALLAQQQLKPRYPSVDQRKQYEVLGLIAGFLSTNCKKIMRFSQYVSQHIAEFYQAKERIAC